MLELHEPGTTKYILTALVAVTNGVFCIARARSLCVCCEYGRWWTAQIPAPTNLARRRFVGERSSIRAWNLCAG